MKDESLYFFEYDYNNKNITKKLRNYKSKQNIFYQKISNLLSIRQKQKAFHPNASRLNLNFGQNIYGFKRISKDKKQTIIMSRGSDAYSVSGYSVRSKMSSIP